MQVAVGVRPHQLEEISYAACSAAPGGGPARETIDAPPSGIGAMPAVRPASRDGRACRRPSGAPARNSSQSAGSAGSSVSSELDGVCFTPTPVPPSFESPGSECHPVHAAEVLFRMTILLVSRKPSATVGTFMPRELERLRTLSRLLDSAFRSRNPLPFRTGPVIGLVPGIGDAISAHLFVLISSSRRRAWVLPKAMLLG